MMKRVITRMLAFAAVLHCGGAWAAGIYVNPFAGAQTVDAGTYGEIVVPEVGFMAMGYPGAMGIRGMGEGAFSSLGVTQDSRKTITTHTIVGWFKMDELPTGENTKDLFIVRCGDVTYCGYKVVLDASGSIKIGRINYDSGSYSWNTDGNKRVVFAGKSGEIVAGKWFHLAIAFTYSTAPSSWRLTPSAWINGSVATKTGDDYIDINLNGGGTVDDIRIGAKVSVAGMFIDSAALSDVNVIKSLATNPALVKVKNELTKQYTKASGFISESDFEDTGLKFASIDQVSSFYKFGAVMGGDSLNSNNGAACKVTSVTRVGDSLFAELQSWDDGYVKCVMLEFRLENDTLRVKQRKRSAKQGGTIGTKYISVDASGNCANANSAGDGSNYFVSSVYLEPTVKPVAKWSSVAADAKGGLYGTPGYNFTMTADTGCTIADGMGKMTKNSGTANLGLKIGWNDADYTSKQLTVVFEYDGYDGSNLGYHSIFSAGWGEDTDLVVYGNNNNGGNIGISSGATSTEGGTQHMVNPAEYIPRAGKMMVTMSGSGSWTGTRIAFASKYADGSYHNFRQVKEDTRDKVDNGQFHYVRFGGTISPIGKYHRPAINIKSVEIYDQAVDASMLLEIARPSATALGDYAQFYNNFQDRVVTMAEGTNTGDLGNQNSGIKYAIFDLPTMTSTDTKFAGNGTNYTVFPGAYATSANGLGWKAFCDGQTGYSAPGLVLRIPAYDASRPFQIKSTFGPFCLAGMVIESGAANGSEIPTLMWDGTNRETSLGDRRASGSVPTFFILHDSYKINHGSTTTIYGDITFDIDSGKGLHIVSGAITINDGAILRLKGAGQIVTKTNSNSTGVVDASGKTLDFTGKTSAHTVGYFDGPLTVSSETIFHFPEELASKESFKLCEGNLVAPEETVYTTVYVGTTAKQVALTFDANSKTVSYNDNVASVGDTEYATLSAAIEAAQTGENHTVNLILDTVGNNEEIPNGITIDLNGHQLTGIVAIKTGAMLKDNGDVKIDGIATSFDVTYTNVLRQAYSNVSGFSSNSDGNNTCTYNYPNTHEPMTDIGAYLKHQPHLKGLDANNGFYASTDVLTFAIVGTMPSTENTIFAHFGHSSSDRYGLLLITGTKKDEVLVAYNHGSTVTPITTMSVPNAATARHVYIVTKEDDRTNDKTTFTVYLDGQKWKTLEITPRFMIIGNVQIGGDFWGLIRHSDTNPNPYVICDANSGGIVNCVRGYNRIISAAEIAKYAEVYSYTSPNGSSERTFASTSSWIDETEYSEVWANTPAEGEATHSGTPLAGASIVAKLPENNTTITVNAPADGLAYESLTLQGAGSVKFVKGENAGKIRVTGVVQIGVPVTITPDSLDISTPPITLLEDGDLTFDYSSFNVSEIYVTTKINLTGQIDQADAKVHFTAPTSLPYRTATMAYDSSIKQYVLTITPNHENGATIYYDSTAAARGNNADKLWTAAEAPKSHTCAFPGDTIVFGQGTFNCPSWINPAVVGSVFEFAKDMTISYALDDSGKLFDGKTVKVDGTTLTLEGHWREIALGTIATTGTNGKIVFTAASDHGYANPSADAISGTAKVVVSEGITLTVTGSVGSPVEVNGTIKAGSEIATVTTTKTNCFVSMTVADGVYTYTPVEVTGEDPLPLDDIKPGESVTPAQDAKPIWSDTTPVEGEGGKYIKVVEGALVVKSGAPVNGLDSFTSYVLGLDPEVATSKPYLSGADTTSTTTLKLVPAGVTVKEGYTVTPKLRVGTTPDSFSDDSTVLTDGGFTITLPTEENDKVKYYQIEYTISK